MLNGRFAARTNSEGRFEFASVAAGSHVLTVVPDNLPLPWVVQGDGRTEVEVGVEVVALGVRGSARAEFPGGRAAAVQPPRSRWPL